MMNKYTFGMCPDLSFPKFLFILIHKTSKEGCGERPLVTKFLPRIPNH